MYMVMIKVEQSMEAASGKMAREPVIRDASGLLVCFFNKHLLSSHFVPGVSWMLLIPEKQIALNFIKLRWYLVFPYLVYVIF